MGILVNFFKKPETFISKLPKEYQYLGKMDIAPILREALKEYGVMEFKNGSNPVIIKWADEIGGWIDQYYTDDSIPWCGLFMAVCAKRAGYPHGQKALSAVNWLSWGSAVTQPAMGDVLVFKRNGGGHVGLYVGEDTTHFHVLGGNQADSVCITRIEKTRLQGIRRQPNYKGGKRVILAGNGKTSYNEA